MTTDLKFLAPKIKMLKLCVPNSTIDKIATWCVLFLLMKDSVSDENVGEKMRINSNIFNQE